MFKVSNQNTRTMDVYKWRLSGAFIVNFEQISCIAENDIMWHAHALSWLAATRNFYIKPIKLCILYYNLAWSLMSWITALQNYRKDPYVVSTTNT